MVFAGVAFAALLAVIGWSTRRLLLHLDRIDSSIAGLRIDLAILFDRGRGIPDEPEREKVQRKLADNGA